MGFYDNNTYDSWAGHIEYSTLGERVEDLANILDLHFQNREEEIGYLILLSNIEEDKMAPPQEIDEKFSFNGDKILIKGKLYSFRSTNKWVEKLLISDDGKYYIAYEKYNGPGVPETWTIKKEMDSFEVVCYLEGLKLKKLDYCQDYLERYDVLEKLITWELP